MSIRYNIISKFYDLIDVFYFGKYKTSPRKYMLENIDNENISILDLCVGTASNAILIAEKRKNANVVGIDISKDMLDVSKRKIEKMKMKNIELKLMNAASLDFHDESFDAVIMSLLLHEISEKEGSLILKEALRVLKKNGKIIVIEWEKPSGVIKNIMFYFVKILEGRSFPDFLKKDLSSFFVRHGLSVLNESKRDYTRVFTLRK